MFQVEHRGKGASEKNPADAPIKCACTAVMFGNILKALHLVWACLSQVFLDSRRGWSGGMDMFDLEAPSSSP